MTTDLRWVAGTLFVLVAVAPAEYLGAAPPLRLASDGHLIVDVVLDQRLDTSVRADFARVLEQLVGTAPVVGEGAPKRPAVIAGMKSLPAFKGAYDPTPYNAELPWPMYGTHARAMPLYKSLGIRGFSFEAHNSWATLFPNFYVSARMMWDADLDYEALIDDVCRHFFGNASSAMRACYDEMDRAIRTYAPQVEWGQEDYPRIFPAAVLARCAAHMEQARRAATDEPVKTRVEMASMGFDYLRDYRACRNAAGGQTDYEQYSAARAPCVTLIDQMHAANTDFIMADVAKRYLDRGLGRLEAQTYAAEMGLGRHWMIIGPFDNHGGNGHARPYAPEQEIDLSKEYAGKEDVGSDGSRSKGSSGRVSSTWGS